MLLEKRNKIRLRDKKIEDAFQDYTWRRDTELARLDGMAPLDMSLGSYLISYKEELDNPPRDQHRFAIETSEGKHIGNCMFYDLNEFRGEAEIGILIGERSYWNNGYGREAVGCLLKLLFSNANIQRVYLKTLAENSRAQRCFLKCGFVPTGRMVINGNHFISMEISHQRFISSLQQAEAAQDSHTPEADL